jgi:hypothetical protein
MDTDDDDDDDEKDGGVSANDDDDSSYQGNAGMKKITIKVKKEPITDDDAEQKTEQDESNDDYNNDDANHNDNFINTTSLADDWLQIFEEMQGDDVGTSTEQEQQQQQDEEGNEFQYSIPTDVSTITYTDGSEYRSQNPYSIMMDVTNYDDYYEQLTETRMIKIKLSSLFTNQIEIP